MTDYTLIPTSENTQQMRYADGNLPVDPPPVFPPPTSVPKYSECTHYASASATGGGAGTEESPWTLKEGMANAVPGMKLGVAPGVYVGEKPAQLYMPAWEPAVSGTQAEPIWIIAQYPAALHDDPTLYTDLRTGGTAQQTITGESQGDAWKGFGAWGKSYIYWAGIYSNSSEVNNKLGANGGLMYAENAQNIQFHQCKVIIDPDLDTDGRLNLDAAWLEITNDVLISDCYIKGSDTRKNNLNGITTYSDRNNTIQHCEFAGGAYAINPKGGVNSSQEGIQSLTCTNNYVHDCNGFIFLKGLTKCTDNPAVLNTIRNNLVVNVGGFCIQAQYDGRQACNSLRIYNNTFIASDITNGRATGLSCAGENPDNPGNDPEFPRDNQAFNNIFVAGCYMRTQVDYTSTYYPTTQYVKDFWADCDTNCIYGLSSIPNFGSSYDNSAQAIQYVTWAEWTTTHDKNSLFRVDPIIDADGYLQPGSPCIGTGVDRLGIWGAVGSPVDMGARVGGEYIGIRTPNTAAPPYTQRVSGSITSPTTWSGSIAIDGDISVIGAGTLTVAAGTWITFTGNYRISGGSTSHILFAGTGSGIISVVNESGVATNRGIDSTGLVELYYTRLRDSKLRSPGESNPPLTIKNCVFQRVKMDNQPEKLGTITDNVFMSNMNYDATWTGVAKPESEHQRNVYVGSEWTTRLLGGKASDNVIVSEWHDGSGSQNDYTHEHVFGAPPDGVFTNNILVGKSFAGTMTLSSDSQSFRRGVIANNTYAKHDSGSGHTFHLNPPDIGLTFVNNACIRTNNIIRSEKFQDGEVAWTDNNANIDQIGETYGGVVIGGKSEGDPGFGSADLSLTGRAGHFVNPDFGYPFPYTEEQVWNYEETSSSIRSAYRAAFALQPGSPLRTGGDTNYADYIGAVAP